MNKRYKPSPSVKKDKVQIAANNELPFLYMEISCSPEVDLQFGVFRKKGQQLEYVGKGSTHTPGTIRAIPSGVLNRLAKLTSRKPIYHSERVDNVYPNHVDALYEMGLAPPTFLTMGELRKGKNEQNGY